MIKVSRFLRKEPKVTFRGSLKEIKADVTMIMWSMIQKDEKTRAALVEAIADVNDAVKQMGE